MTRKNKTGRPSSYDHEDLARAVCIVEAKGETPTASAVKTVLCGELEISAGINGQSLEKQLERFLTERGERQLREQIAVLPDEVKAGARETAELVERAILSAQAPLFTRMREEAEKDLEAEKKARHALARQNDELLEAATKATEENTRLRNELRDLGGERDRAAAELEDAKRRIAELERVGDLRVELERMIRETFGKIGEESPAPVAEA